MNFRWVRPAQCFVVMLATVIAAGAGCAREDWNWDWLGGGTQNKQRRPVTKGRRANDPSRTAKAPEAKSKTPDDRRAQDVNEQMTRYAERMDRDDQSTRSTSDFNDKIRRQEDPNRRQRIRKVADRTRDEPVARTEPVVRPVADDQTPAETTHASVPPSTKTDRPEVEPLPTPVQPEQPTTDPKIAPPSDAAADPGTAAIESDATPPEESGVDTQITPNAATTTIEDTPEEPTTSPPPGDGPTRTPVLDPNIHVSAGPETEQPAESTIKKAGDPTRPVANDMPPPTPPVDTFKQRFETLQSRVKAEPNNLEARYSFIMMCLADGLEDEALAPVDGTDSDIQEMIQAHVRALVAAQSSPGRDPARIANYQLEKWEEVRNIVRSRADLRVPTVVLCTAIDGFGRYTPIQPAEFKAGQKNRVLLYIEVDNFHSEKTSSGLYRTLLSVRQSLLTKGGEELWNTHDANIEDLARRRRHDFYLTVGPLAIPKTLSPGEFVLKVEVEDVLAGKINSEVAGFRMVP